MDRDPLFERHLSPPAAEGYPLVAVASQVFDRTMAPDVVACLHKAAGKWGFPASVLSDNGCIYTAAHVNGRAALAFSWRLARTRLREQPTG